MINKGKIVEITCRSACNKLKHARPYPWDLNVYRGCRHGCKYCYAMYSHEFVLGKANSNFFQDIYIKTNIIEQLEKQFSSPSWRREVVNLGSVTDSYQPIEKEYKIMREVLKVFIKYKNPCIISTKSDLILRDFDLIEQLAQVTYVNVACTITASNESIRRKLEPYGVSSKRRFEVLKEFSKTKASRGVHIMPIVPYLTDDKENLENIYSEAKKIKASYVLPGLLNLKGPTRGNFLDFVYEEYPDIFPSLAMLYSSQCNLECKKDYRSSLYEVIRGLEEKYSLTRNYMKGIPSSKGSEGGNEQLTFF